jgi:hypothetical protein
MATTSTSALPVYAHPIHWIPETIPAVNQSHSEGNHLPLHYGNFKNAWNLTIFSPYVFIVGYLITRTSLPLKARTLNKSWFKDISLYSSSVDNFHSLYLEGKYDSLSTTDRTNNKTCRLYKHPAFTDAESSLCWVALLIQRLLLPKHISQMH